MSKVPPIHSCGYIHQKGEPCPGHISNRNRADQAIKGISLLYSEMHRNNEPMTDADVDLWCLITQHPAVTADHDEQETE